MTPIISGVQCTDEYRALVEESLADPIGSIMTLSREVGGQAEAGEGLQLLVALLSCYLVPLLGYLVTFIIVILNSFITMAIKGLVEFSRYDSLTLTNSAVVVRLAVAQFLNTAVIAIVVNMANKPSTVGVDDAPIPHICFDGQPANSTNIFGCVFGSRGFLLRGNHFDIGPRWYYAWHRRARAFSAVHRGVSFMPSLPCLLHTS